MDLLTAEQLQPQVKKLASKLQKRASNHRRLDRYYEGNCPLPEAVVQAKVTKAYTRLMGMSAAPWGSLVADSIADRLEPIGISDTDKSAAEKAWGVWQDNQLDAEFNLAVNTAMISGRAYAIVWPDENDKIDVSFDSPEQTIVQYAEGHNRKRQAALRMFEGDDGRAWATLYRPEGLYHLQSKTKRSRGGAGTVWVPRLDADGEWQFENPLDRPPVVELRVNRRLKPGCWGYARGEYEHCLGLLDRINLLTFLGLVVAFWMGFPLRGVIGEDIRERVLTDDNGDPIIGDDGEPETEPEPPFDAHASGVFQLTSKDAKIVEYAAADRGLLSVHDELDQLSALTMTPRHYFPLKGGMANLSADAIRANEGGQARKAPRHQRSLGEAVEEILRISGELDEEKSYTLSPRAATQWADHETRSLAERADAASKLGALQTMPWVAIAELALGASQDQINRWKAANAGDAISKLLDAAAAPAQPNPVGDDDEPAPSPEPEPVPA